MDNTFKKLDSERKESKEGGSQKARGSEQCFSNWDI